jgi:uncharacterized protein YndB with AHSA1/START domain
VRSTHHDTLLIERTIDAPVGRVFRAWADRAALERWYLPGDASWVGSVESLEFRAGGSKRLAFGPPGEPPFREECRYEDIVPDERIVYTMTILRGDARLTASLVTVELAALPSGTSLRVTDQIAILDGVETREARERGWGEVLDKLSRELASA